MTANLKPPLNLKTLLKIEEKMTKRTPSAYAQEMQRSSEERFANIKQLEPPRILERLDMTNSTFHKLTSVDMDQTLFQPYPTKIIFQNFIAGETYKLPLWLFNMDKVPRRVRLEQAESQFFHVAGPDGTSSKVAPGLSASFTVVFTPQNNKDHQHALVFVTERERFEVPVAAIGPRAILDFRDEVLLPVCRVKATTERTHLMHNFGNSTANFKLHTEKPFSVEPSSGSLEVGESLQVTVTFSPLSVGEHTQDLLVYYHTGEVICVSLCGVCEELDIHLESSTVDLKKTYISLSSVQSVSLTNTSDIPLQYYWSTQPRHREALCSRAQEGHEGPLSSPPQDSVSYLSNEKAITLHPVKGEIWPKVTCEFNVVFKPTADRLYEHSLYCHITGREAPLSLIVKGEGMGPRLVPSYNLMDMRNVFIGDKDWYEVTLMNKGLIDAPFQMSSPDTTFGRCFSFSPTEGVVRPGDCQVVKVTFSSPVLGPFSEDLLITVEGQTQPVNLNFRGCVIGPIFDFDVKELNFGDVAFGFPQTVLVTLFNKSFIRMTFSLRVLGDGSGPPSVTCVQQVSRKQWQSGPAEDTRMRPKEFTLSPQTDTVSVMSQVTIKVTLCSNTVRRYKLALAVDVERVGKEIRTLPINARCVAPYLEVTPPLLDYQSCFLNLLYEQKVVLQNTTSLPVCYGLSDQEFEEDPSLLAESPIPRGMIPAHSSVDLPVCVTAKAVGRLRRTIHVAVFGSTQLPLEVVLSCNGQGPIVHAQSTHLDFGRIPVLKDTSKSLCLINHSPVSALFSICMGRRKSFWRVEPAAGEVPAGGKLELQVVAYLKDTLDFEDQLQVLVQHSNPLTVAVSARGTGSTIVSDKPFAPGLDLGTRYSHGSHEYHFKLTNLGLRTQRMYWRTEGKDAKMPSQTLLPPIIPPKKKGQLHQRTARGSARGEGPVFILSPSRVELFPGQSVDMVLTGSCQSPKVVHERLMCRSIVGNTGSYNNFMTVDVTCCFVAPMLSISPKQLHFYIEKAKGTVISPQHKKLKLKNVATLTLCMDLVTEEPFSLCDVQDVQSSSAAKTLILEEGKQVELWVCLDPGFCDDRVSRDITKSLQIKYRGHPQLDSLKLHGEIHFPSLHFSSTTVDFGCVLNSTETHREVTITNCSPLPVTYRWTFVDQCISPRDLEECSVSLEDGGKHSKKEVEKSPRPASIAPSRLVSSDTEPRSTYLSAKVEEMFDILPIYGGLQPGEQQVTSFSFYGHMSVSRQVVAQCHVEDGLVYEITLTADAPNLSFSLDPPSISFGPQLVHRVAEAEVLLKNTGNIGFHFTIWNPDRNEASQNKPDISLRNKNSAQSAEDADGQPLVFPFTGYVEAGTETCLRVCYAPDSPGTFEKRLHLQVECLPLQDILVVGEGGVYHFTLQLPQNDAPEFDSNEVEQSEATVETNKHPQESTRKSSPASDASQAATPLQCQSPSQVQLTEEGPCLPGRQEAVLCPSQLSHKK